MPGEGGGLQESPLRTTVEPEALKERQKELKAQLRDLESLLLRMETPESDYREARDHLRAELSEVEADLRLLEMEESVARIRLALGALMVGLGLVGLAAPGGPLTAQSWSPAGPPDRVALSALRFLLPTLAMPGAMVIAGEYRRRSGAGEMPPRLWRVHMDPGEAHRRLTGALFALGARGLRPGPPLEAAFGLGPTRLRLEVTFRPLPRVPQEPGDSRRPPDPKGRGAVDEVGRSREVRGTTEVRMRSWGRPGNWERWRTEMGVARGMVERGLPWEAREVELKAATSSPPLPSSSSPRGSPPTHPQLSTLG